MEPSRQPPCGRTEAYNDQPQPIQLDAPDPALDSGRRLRGRGRGRIHDYLEAAGHGDDEQGPLFCPIRNNRTGRIDRRSSLKAGIVAPTAMLRKLAAYAARTSSTSHSRSWGRSNARGSCSTGSKARNCADAAMPGSTSASSVIFSRRSSAP